jgi:hypothetical protein
MPMAKAADDVDEEDQDAGDGVAAHELAGTVHGAEEVGLVTQLGATALGLLVVDQAGREVGVDRHLLAGQSIEREARADLGDALGALGDDDEVDDHQDGEDDQPDREVAADQEVAEALDDLAGRARTGMAFEQHDARRGDVQRQAQQGGQQQHRGEGGEVQRAHHLRRHHHHHQRHRDVEGEQQIQHEGRQRQHHHGEHQQHRDRRAQAQHHAAVGAQQGLQAQHQFPHALASSASPAGCAPASCGSKPGGTAGSGGASKRRPDIRPFNCIT